MGNWEKGYQCFNLLSKESNWSKVSSSSFRHANKRSHIHSFAGYLRIRESNYTLRRRRRDCSGQRHHETSSRPHAANRWKVDSTRKVRRSSISQIRHARKPSLVTRSRTRLRPQLSGIESEIHSLRTPFGSSLTRFG